MNVGGSVEALVKVSVGTSVGTPAEDGVTVMLPVGSTVGEDVGVGVGVTVGSGVAVIASVNMPCPVSACQIRTLCSGRRVGRSWCSTFLRTAIGEACTAACCLHISDDLKDYEWGNIRQQKSKPVHWLAHSPRLHTDPSHPCKPSRCRNIRSHRQLLQSNIDCLKKFYQPYEGASSSGGVP